MICTARCSVTASATLDARTARRLGVRRRIAAATRRSVATANLNLRPAKTAARRIRRADVTLTVTATSAAGERVTATRRVRLTR